MAGNDSYTKLLLHMDGDQSSNQHQLNFYGQYIYLSGAEKKFGSSSIYCTGNNSGYIRVPSAGSLNFYTDDFTIDFWINIASANKQVMGKGTSTGGWWIHVEDGTGHIRFIMAPSNEVVTSTTNIADSEWHHIAISRYAGRMRLFVDGIMEDSTIYANTLSTSAEVTIGNIYHGAAGNFAGYLDEIRFTNLLARWTTDDSFTPPTTPYTSDANTALLYHCEGDKSSSGHQIQTMSHSISASTSKWNGAFYCAGSWDNHLRIDDNDAFVLGTNPFTIDFWVNLSSNSNALLFEQNDGDYLQIFINGTTNSIGLYVFVSSTTEINNLDLGTLNTGQWYHVAYVRDGNDFHSYLNGVWKETQSSSVSIPNMAAQLSIGARTNGVLPMTGYVDEFRISNGIARWTGTGGFTPPTSPYSTEIYSIQGTAPANTRVIIVNEADWALEYSDLKSGAYNIECTSGPKLVSGRNTSGEIVSYGNVTPNYEEI